MQMLCRDSINDVDELFGREKTKTKQVMCILLNVIR